MIEIGESLRNAREKKGISLEKISQKTNIGISFLKAMEDGDFHLIPGKFYVKSYLKNYLQAIEVDQKEFFSTHEGWTEKNFLNKRHTSDVYISKLRYSSFKRKSTFLALFTIFLILVTITTSVFYLYKKKVLTLPHRFFFFKKIELPPTGLPVEFKNNTFSIDRSAVHIRIDFSDECWTLVRRGKREKIAKTYEKGDRLTLGGYDMFFYIGNPSCVKFYLNEEELSYLNNLTQPEKLEINPGTAARILRK